MARSVQTGCVLRDCARISYCPDLAVGVWKVIESGAITMKDLVTMFPFPGVIVLKRVPGNVLLSALEAGVSLVPAYEGRFPQVSGIRFRFDPAKPRGSRIESLVLVGGKKLDMEAIYTVAMTDYVGRGKVPPTQLVHCQVDALTSCFLVVVGWLHDAGGVRVRGWIPKPRWSQHHIATPRPFCEPTSGSQPQAKA